MANKKRIFTSWETGKTIYGIVERESDDFLLDSNDGTFSATPASAFNTLSADVLQSNYYKLDESRTVWTDGNYIVNVYLQVGGSPDLANDILINSGFMVIVSDVGVYEGNNTTLANWNFSSRIVSGLDNIITGITVNDKLTLNNNETVLDIIRADTPTLTITLGKNLTGQTVTLYVKKNIDDSDANALVNRAVTIDDVSNGIVSITLTAMESGTVGNMFAELVGVNGGVTLTLAQFRLNILRRVKD